MYQFKYPSLISIFTTNKCNLYCRHCCFGAKPTTEHEMSREQLLSIIDKITECGIVCLDFSGGEPFTRDDILDAIEYAFEKGIKSISVATNMLLLDDARISRLKNIQDKWKLLYLRISVDGPDAESHEWLRGKGTFVKTISQIERLKIAGINIREMNTVVSKFNYDKIGDTISLAKKYGIKTSVLLPLIPVGRAKEIDDYVISSEEWKKLCLNKKYLEEKYQIEVFADSPVSSTADESKWNKSLPCMCGYQFLGITPNGDYTVCPIVSKGDGNIWDITIEDYWKNSQLLKNIRDITKLKGKCKTCTHLNLCRGGCRGLAEIISGDILKPDPMCWL